jgi:hypothetical protein
LLFGVVLGLATRLYWRLACKTRYSKDRPSRNMITGFEFPGFASQLCVPIGNEPAERQENFQGIVCTASWSTQGKLRGGLSNKRIQSFASSGGLALLVAY